MLAMNTVTTWQTYSRSLDDTLRLGEALGHKLRGGEVIELISDLGGGKTTFIRGLAHGMGADERVASPSFTIARQYQAGKLALHHYDFYRLDNPGIMTHELAESIADPRVVMAVEWPRVVEQVLPTDRLGITMQVTGEQTRKLEFRAGPKHEHLLERLP